MERLERTCHTLRAEVSRWRDRAKGALASERLVQLKQGLPSSMFVPAVAANPLALLAKDKSARTETPHAIALANAKSVGRGERSSANGDYEEEDPDDPMRLRARIEYWRAEAEHEQQRQKAFQTALWASEHFSMAQKQKAVAWLRQPPADSPSSLGLVPERTSGERLIATAPVLPPASRRPDSRQSYTAGLGPPASPRDGYNATRPYRA